MEKLKSAVPDSLKRMVGESTSDDLPRTCSSLLDFFLHFEPFHQIVRDLADPESGLCGKSKDAALEAKRTGNQCFLRGDYAKALACYSQALRVAPFEADDMETNLFATLYVNRATVLLKMNLLTECLRDCTRALQISPTHAKAWYRRGKANASLGNYDNAVRDLNVAESVESSVGGKKQIEGELKIILEQCKRTSSSVLQHNENDLVAVDEQPQIKLRCVTTQDKGRGMASSCDISPASLVHIEEPFAVIISKQCRETHCHYCLNDLPADKVPCGSCSISLYCSKLCQIRAGGKMFRTYPKDHDIFKNLSSDLGKYVAEITLGNDSDQDIEDIPEHKHECQGVHWPAVLPSEIVLAGRVLVKSMVQKSATRDGSNLVECLELSQFYTQMDIESKLVLHIYSIVLVYCLQHSYAIELPINGVSVSQIITLVSQITVNCMTVVRMKSVDAHGLPDQFGEFSCSGNVLTSNVEQVRVGKAIYRAGSLFNHSCQPNVHAYFLSRTLHIRTTKFVAAGCPLELSYGPQVGLWDCKDRLKFLEDEYLFRCQCSGCSEVNLSDFIINAFHCVNPNCSGIVLESSVVNCEKQKCKHFTRSNKLDKYENDDIHEMPQHALDQSNGSLQISPSHCLKCGSYCNLESSRAEVNKAWTRIKRLQDSITAKEISSTAISDALGALGSLKSKLHPYNRGIAEAEDNLAQAFCLAGELQLAMDHCKASIRILEKLHDPNDIVIANELVKLSSIQISLGDITAVDSIHRISDTFSLYYGDHVNLVFPYLQSLQERQKSFVQ
ncbi:SET and MYND domain-containing protein 4 [Quillaja saponaria]|uniref:SET and MYND domain-containing protein 4 n=1 Tax=Quillaja saponaria TaxID=32244 RepID=A0AAD7PLX3_QUISA|nr:SET and MYND domain-containing protein 4 [Quillaja saponaria]